MESTLKFQRGDIYFIRLDSSTGSEQSGTRPAVAVAPEEADKLVASLEESGERAYRIGQVAKTGEDGERLVLL